MSGTNSRNRIKYYSAQAFLFGEYCRICGEKGDYYTLVVDHIDDDNNNNAFDNHELLCRKCNSIKDPRGEGNRQIILSPARVKEYMVPTGQTAEMAKNAIAEPLYRKWLFRMLRQEDKVEYNTTIDAGAEVSHASIDAVKRYTKKVCSQMGWAELVKDENDVIYIRLRKKWRKNIGSVSEVKQGENESRENSSDQKNENTLDKN